MKTKDKIKVFLGGYINSINAQNLNCRSLALHLDKNRFELGALIYPGASLPVGKEFAHVKKFTLPCKLYRPLQWVRYLTYLRGLLWCDVAYLPKGDIFRFCQKVARMFGKKTFITVEGVLDKETYEGSKKAYGSDDAIRQLCNGYDKTYSITRFMASKNKELLGIRSDGVLYLGVEAEQFKIPQRCHNGMLSKVIFIGSDLKRKRVNEYLGLSKLFPEIEFHIVGGDGNFAGITDESPSTLPNVKYHGRLGHKELAALLATMDLHIFTSRSEGFPKVTLETAAAGVPSIVYSDYGAAEWITTGKDGYVVNTFDEIVDIITDLRANPHKLPELSANAVRMAERFDWANLVCNWEEAINDLVK